MRGAILTALFPIVLICQVPTGPVFDVASIKPSYGRRIDGFSHSSIDTPSPGRFVAENSSLGELIRYAFQLKLYQLAGPSWLNDDSECFDVAAKTTSVKTDKEMRLMLQTLLADRFHLVQHRETRVLPVLKLVVGKNGPRMQPAAPDGQHPGTSSVGGRLIATHVFMSAFAGWLSKELHRPVLDETELKGRYDFTLLSDAGKRETDDAPSLASALQEQLVL